MLVIPRSAPSPTPPRWPPQAPDVLVDLVAAAAAVVGGAGGLDEGYRLVFNTGPAAHQTVFHAHLHVLGGRIDGLAAGMSRLAALALAAGLLVLTGCGGVPEARTAPATASASAPRRATADDFADDVERRLAEQGRDGEADSPSGDPAARRGALRRPGHAGGVHPVGRRSAPAPTTTAASSSTRGSTDDAFITGFDVRPGTPRTRCTT